MHRFYKVTRQGVRDLGGNQGRASGGVSYWQKISVCRGCRYRLGWCQCRYGFAPAGHAPTEQKVDEVTPDEGA